MKVTFKKLVLVILGTLLIGLIGSETYAGGYVVNKGRYYCPVHNVIYDPLNEVHQNCQPVVRHIVVAPEQYCSKCNTKYPANFNHVCPPVRVAVVKERKQLQTQPQRHAGRASQFLGYQKNRGRVESSYVPLLQGRYQEVPPVKESGSTNFSLAKYANVNIAFVQRPTRVILGNLYGVNRYGYRYVRYPAGTGYTSRGNRVLWGSNW